MPESLYELQHGVGCVRGSEGALTEVARIVPSAVDGLEGIPSGSLHIQVTGGVHAGDLVSAALDAEEIEGLANRRQPERVGDRKRPARETSRGEHVVPRCLQDRKIQNLERALRAFDARDGTGHHHVPRGGIVHLERRGLQARGDGLFREIRAVADMAVRDLARGDVPAFVLFGVDALEFEVVEIIRDLFHLHPALAGGQLEDPEFGHAIATQMGDFPEDAVPLSGREFLHDMVVVWLEDVLCHAFGRDSEIEGVDGYGGWVDVHPQGDPVEGRPVLRIVEREDGRRLSHHPGSGLGEDEGFIAHLRREAQRGLTFDRVIARLLDRSDPSGRPSS